MRRWISGAAVAVVLAMGLAACGDDTTETPVAPTTPSTVTQTDTFTGTVAASEVKIHTFSVRPGLVTVTLTALGPDTSVPIGLALGTYDLISCNAVTANSAAIQGNKLVGTASSAAVLCVRVYDAGNLTDVTVNYTLTAEYQILAGS